MAIDETIKAGIGVAKWSAVAAIACGLAANLAKLVSYIFSVLKPPEQAPTDDGEFVGTV